MNIVINNLDRKSDSGFVTTVHWTVTKTAGEHTASQYGTESFSHTEGNLIPYEQLTPEIVTGWLTERWGADGLSAKESALDAQLAALADPPVVAGVPWTLLKNP